MKKYMKENWPVYLIFLVVIILIGKEVFLNQVSGVDYQFV